VLRIQQDSGCKNLRNIGENGAKTTLPAGAELCRYQDKREISQEPHPWTAKGCGTPEANRIHFKSKGAPPAA